MKKQLQMMNFFKPTKNHDSLSWNHSLSRSISNTDNKLNAENLLFE